MPLFFASSDRRSCRVLFLIPLTMLALCSLAAGCAVDEDVARRKSKRTLDSYYQALIAGDEAAFEACFKNREAYLVHGSHSISIWYKDFGTEGQDAVQENYDSARERFHEMELHGREIVFETQWMNRTKRFVLQPKGNKWLIAEAKTWT